MRQQLRGLRDIPSPQDVASVVQRSASGCTSSILNAFIFVLSTWSTLGGGYLWAWCGLTVFVNVIIGLRARRAGRRVVMRVSRRAARRLVLFSFLLALPWAILIGTVMIAGTHYDRMMAIVVCSGTMTGATFMLYRVPAASFAFYLTILLPLSAACLVADAGQFWVIALYTGTFGVYLVSAALQAGETARQRDASVSELSRIIGELEGAHDRISQLAYFDTVTGLPNRKGFMDRLENAIRDARHLDGKFSVLMLDLDRFKNVNDTLGHHIGDRLLALVGERLSAILREDATLARLGGDEFAVIVPDMVTGAALNALANRIIQALTEPAWLDGRQVFPGTSIGAARYPMDGSDSRTLLIRADIALNKAKEAGRGRFLLFDVSLRDALHHENWIEKELRLAIESRQIRMVYQPKVDIATGRILGAEALVRWEHPERGIISPNQFLPVAAERGLLAQVSHGIFARVAEDILTWKRRGISLGKVAINVHALDLKNPVELLENLKALIARGIPPQEIIVEVTEGCFLGRGTDTAPIILDAIDDLGFELSLDDFGTGYASLTHLGRLPVSEIKIDRNFVIGLMTSRPDRAIVAATVEIARVLGLRIVAEGVETQGQAELLAEIGVSIGQGYLWSEALSPRAIIDLMERSGSVLPPRVSAA